MILLALMGWACVLGLSRAVGLIVCQSGLKLIVTKIFQADVLDLACLCVKMCVLQTVLFSAHVCRIRTVVLNSEWVLLMYVSENMLRLSTLTFKHAN